MEITRLIELVDAAYGVSGNVKAVHSGGAHYATDALAYWLARVLAEDWDGSARDTLQLQRVISTMENAMIKLGRVRDVMARIRKDMP